MMYFRLLLGVLMLFAGGRLYWLFLGVIGFIFGFDLAGRVLQTQTHDMIIVVALLSGLAGALLAVFLQKIAVLAGGFLAGGYLALKLMEEFDVRDKVLHWLILGLACVIGAVLMRVLFKWALILLSSGVGSVLILQSVHPGAEWTRLLIIVLFILGIAVQTGLLRRKSRR